LTAAFGRFSIAPFPANPAVSQAKSNRLFSMNVARPKKTVESQDCGENLMDDTKDLTERPMEATFAAVVYTPKQTDRTALPKFVSRLKASGVAVAGILQESRVRQGDKMRTIESVDITTGARIPIKRPMRVETDCGLDVSNLIETSAILRNARGANPDLVVVEKFGDKEQNGEGLMDEIMQIVAEDIPLLIAVPEPALDNWQEKSGGMGAVLEFTQDAMQGWWAGLTKSPPATRTPEPARSANR
jgi:nucleoside-triphosphatase THEP1